MLNIAINWAVDNNRLAKNPIRGYDTVEEPEPARIMLDEGKANGQEWQKLYQAIHKDKKALFLCLYETAMRPAEVFLMRWEWVNVFAKTITIPAGITKTKKGRVIPISERLWEALKDRPRVSELVFPNVDTGKPFNGVAKAFKAACRRSGLAGRGLTPYCLRRTRLTIWNAIDSTAARELGGHAKRRDDPHLYNYVQPGLERLADVVMRAA
jgi:integrase